jgi:hypothetical protein
MLLPAQVPVQVAALLAMIEPHNSPSKPTKAGNAMCVLLNTHPYQIKVTHRTKPSAAVLQNVSFVMGATTGYL